jgi:hypothetical protein
MFYFPDLQDLKYDKQFIIDLIIINIGGINFAPDIFFRDDDIIDLIYQSHDFCELYRAFKEHTKINLSSITKLIYKIVVECGKTNFLDIVQTHNPSKLNDRDLIESIVKFNPSLFSYASDTLKSDKEFISKLVERNILRILHYINLQLRGRDSDFFERLFKINVNAILYAHSSIRRQLRYKFRDYLITIGIDLDTFLHNNNISENDFINSHWIL